MAQRRDGWSNLVTGLGDAMRDKRFGAVPFANFLRQPEAELLWRADDMAARVIEKPPRDAMRRGFVFQVKPNTGEALERGEDSGEDAETPIDGKTQRGPDDLDPTRQSTELEGRAYGPLSPRTSGRYDVAQHAVDPTLATAAESDTEDAKAQQEAVQARCKKLQVVSRVREALTFERAYGGAAIFLGTVDRSPGRSPNVLSRPLDLRYVEELKFLTVLTPAELTPYSYQGDPLAPDYGEVKLWTITPKSKGPNPRGSLLRVHASRLILFKGIRTSRFMVEAQRGFGDSILNRVVTHIRNFSTGFDAAAVLVHDFAQAVFKMKGLVETLQADDEGLIQKRAAAMDYVRSTLRAMVIDSDEEFERKQTPVTGLPDLLDRLANRLAAATGMPVTMLMGQAPAGLNATGQADRDWYNENVSVLQGESALPAIERIVDVELHATSGATSGKAPEGWSVSFPPLEEPTEEEKAKTRLAVAQADQIYINTGVLHPEEVAASRFAGEEYSMETKLDTEVREAALEMAEQQQAQQQELHEQQVESGGVALEGAKLGNKLTGKELRSRPKPKGK